MATYVFVPLSDELLYEHPELINGPLVPFDFTCVAHEQPSATVTANNHNDKTPRVGLHRSRSGRAVAGAGLKALPLVIAH